MSLRRITGFKSLGYSVAAPQGSTCHGIIDGSGLDVTHMLLRREITRAV